jgi:hypothetical protein
MVDLANAAGLFPGASLSGSFGSPNYTPTVQPDAGQGNVTLTYNSTSINVVIYAPNLVLDMQSRDPDVELVE